MGGYKSLGWHCQSPYPPSPHCIIDGAPLLTGLRSFIVHLEPHLSVESLGKVCKLYHSIARNNSLSIKISNNTLVEYHLMIFFLDILDYSFRKGHDFDIVEV